MIAKYVIRATSPCDYTKKPIIYSNVGVNELSSMLPLFIFVLINYIVGGGGGWSTVFLGGRGRGILEGYEM
jgi:hypothetical protein